MTWGLVTKHDRWPAQVEEAFGFLFDLGFRVIDCSTYRLGESIVVGDDVAGVLLESDFDSGVVSATLIRLDGGLVPTRWWEGGRPRPSMGLAEVATVLAPESLEGRSGLPRLRREADRAPHLEFWATVLKSVATPWLHGDGDWYDQTERRLR